MCGRYAFYSPAEAMRELFGVAPAEALIPRYNVAPTQPVAVVRAGEAARVAALHRWGLVPFWAKDLAIGNRMINARCETVHEKPAYREAWVRRRCLIPADGFYEWKAVAGGKQPYFIAREDRGLMAFAGLWERWRQRDGGDTVYSCTIVTTQANEKLASLHDRMPVIIPPDAFDTWLQGSNADAAALMRPADDDVLTFFPVSRAVNSPQNDNPSLIAADRLHEP